MRDIEMVQFKRMQVEARSDTGLAFSIMRDGTMRINGKLMEKLHTGYPNVYSIADGSVVAIRPVGADVPDACRIKKSGEAPVHRLITDLDNAGVILPARYRVEWCEKNSFWQGEIDKEYCFRKPQKPLPEKKKAKGIGRKP